MNPESLKSDKRTHIHHLKKETSTLKPYSLGLSSEAPTLTKHAGQLLQLMRCIGEIDVVPILR